jgi:hypothetical protein
MTTSNNIHNIVTNITTTLEPLVHVSFPIENIQKIINHGINKNREEQNDITIETVIGTDKNTMGSIGTEDRKDSMTNLEIFNRLINEKKEMI